MMEIGIKIVTWALKLLASSIVLFYIVIWFLTPTTRGWTFETLVSSRTSSQFLSNIAGNYILYTVPVIALALVGTLLLEVKKKFPVRPQSRGRTCIWRMLWTQPIFINKVLGVVMGIDILVIVVTLVAVLWLFCSWYLPQAQLIDAAPHVIGVHKGTQKLVQAAIMLGRVSALPISLLFIPVSRSSPILRLVDIPFEQAVKYHIWLAYLTLVILVAHGAAFTTVFALNNHISHLSSWGPTGVAVLPGVFALIGGIIMWITSLPWIRRQFFNCFYYVHQLYWVFAAFYVYHVGVKSAGYTMGGIFLFCIDRFIRFWQSRRNLNVANVQVFPGGIIKLTMSNSSTVNYNALSFMYLNIPSISRLQWHPFSLASSTLDGAKQMTLYIKSCGVSSWTHDVYMSINAMAATSTENRCPSSLHISGEGPYGQESNYFLQYRTLILIAGGIGITPFMSIISEILHRYRCGGQESWLPENVLLIWVVRSTAELHILLQISPSSIFADYESSNFNIRVEVYVTQPVMDDEMLVGLEEYPTLEAQDPISDCVSPVVATGNNLWMFVVIVAASIMSVFIFGIFQFNLIDPRNKELTRAPFPEWVHASFFFISMLVGVIGAGGIALAFWNDHSNLKDKKYSGQGGPRRRADTMTEAPTLLDLTNKIHKSRPSFSSLFDELDERHMGSLDVGVLVSGPEGLQRSVAHGCCHHIHNFHFHSVSFTL